jgi:hypothetical protein
VERKNTTKTTTTTKPEDTEAVNKGNMTFFMPLTSET